MEFYFYQNKGARNPRNRCISLNQVLVGVFEDPSIKEDDILSKYFFSEQFSGG